MIESPPTSWKALQDRVALILKECGVDACTEKQVKTARSDVTFDVWAHDSSSVPPQTYVVECKHWRSKVPQHVVHSFRTTVGDSGANWGAIVSSSGFQTGSYEAAKYSNVRLLDWNEFLALFEAAWFDRFFCPTVAEACVPLIEYAEPINSGISRKADALCDVKREEFMRLRECHFQLATLCQLMRFQAIGGLQLLRGRIDSAKPEIPLRRSIRAAEIAPSGSLPDSILDADTYRDLLSEILSSTGAATESFDELFGERA
jgi:restriction system protein